MPILNGHLDPSGHAIVDLFVFPTQARRRVLQAAGKSIPPPKPIRGMIDGGATVTVIDPQVRQALNLVPHRIVRVSVPNASTPVRAYSYKVDLGITYAGTVMVMCPLLAVLEMPLSHLGADVMVGCDVLSMCQYVHNGTAGTFSLSH